MKMAGKTYRICVPKAKRKQRNAEKAAARRRAKKVLTKKQRSMLLKLINKLFRGAFQN